MPVRSARGMILLGVLALSAVPSIRGAELTDATMERLLQELKPGEDELWRTVPWKIALLDAQQQAAREKKPIFIWAMDGHPLGCT